MTKTLFFYIFVKSYMTENLHQPTPQSSFTYLYLDRHTSLVCQCWLVHDNKSSEWIMHACMNRTYVHSVNYTSSVSFGKRLLFSGPDQAAVYQTLPYVSCCVSDHKHVCSNTPRLCDIPDRSYRQSNICWVFLHLLTVSQVFCYLVLVDKLKRKTHGPSSSRLCMNVSCRVCCCFAEGLWEVLALRGQLSTPPSSGFDRHPAFTQAFSLFHVIRGPSSCKTGLAWCDSSINVKYVHLNETM